MAILALAQELPATTESITPWRKHTLDNRRRLVDGRFSEKTSHRVKTSETIAIAHTRT